jgi:hypothetical protein
LGLIVHRILTNVAEKVPYDELFSDTDWLCAITDIVKFSVCVKIFMYEVE